MPLTTIDYTVATPPTAQDNAVLDTLSDVLVAGVEGGIYGIGGWAVVSDYQWTDRDHGDTNDLLDAGRTRTATALINEHHESQDSDEWGDTMRLSPEVMLTGVLRLINGTVQGDTGYYSTPLKDRLLDMLKDPNENDDFDAADADIIIQAALLGEVVYG